MVAVVVGDGRGGIRSGGASSGVRGPGAWKWGGAMVGALVVVVVARSYLWSGSCVGGVGALLVKDG